MDRRLLPNRKHEVEARVASETPTVATVPGSAGREVPRAHSARFVGSSSIVSTPQGLVLDPRAAGARTGRLGELQAPRHSCSHKEGLGPSPSCRGVSERGKSDLLPDQGRPSVFLWNAGHRRRRGNDISLTAAGPFHIVVISLGSALPSRSISQRPAWNVSPRASKTSGASLRSEHVWSFADQTQQGHVLDGIRALVQQSSQASGHSPRPAPVAAGVNAARAQTWAGATQHGGLSAR